MKKQVTAQTVSSVLSSVRPSQGTRLLRTRRRVSGAWLDGAPSDGFAAKVGDEAARRRRSGMADVGLVSKSLSALRDGECGERLEPAQLESLALASRRRTAGAEHRLHVVPAGLVGGHDRDLSFGFGHVHDSADRVDLSPG